MREIFFILIHMICLNLSHAQFDNLQNPIKLPSAITNIPNQNNSTAPAYPNNSSQETKDPVGAITNSLQPTTPNQTTGTQMNYVAGPKYEEYQSICRTHEYDQMQFNSDEIKNKRIDLIKEKIKTNPASIKLQIRLLKEYSEQKKIHESEEISISLKEKKITAYEKAMIDAYLYFSKLERKKAKDSLNTILSDFPNDVDALKLLAEIYKSEFNYFEYSAIYYDLQKITKNSYNEELCEALTLDANYSDAEKFCLAGLKNKTNPFFLIYLGIASREQKNLEEAQKKFIEANKIKETEIGLSCLAEIHQIQKNYSESELIFNKATVNNRKSVRAWLGLAWVQFEEKKYSDSLNSFEKACVLDKKVNVEIRKALKRLISEKSTQAKNYSAKLDYCSSN